MDKYSTLIFFPNAVGYLYAVALRRAGKKVLVINHPSAKVGAIPDIIGAAVFMPDIFLKDLTCFGLPEPELGQPQSVELNIEGRRVLIEPDEARQVLALAHILPELDRQLMRILNRLEISSKQMMPRLKALYNTLPGKRSLGRKLIRKSVLFPFRSNPLRALPRNIDGDVARWALHLPAYISMGIQGVDGGLRAIAAGYGFRSPRICGINGAKLNVEAEHLYLSEGGDVAETHDRSDIALSFAGSVNTAEIDGVEFAFVKAFIGKNIAAQSLAQQGGIASGLHGLTMLSHSFSWKPPKNFDASRPRHGVIVADINRPPVNDNLVMYSITPSDTGIHTVAVAIAVERDETLTEHFINRRRGYLFGRMVNNFAKAMGGEADMPAPPSPNMYPTLRVTGRGGFCFLDDNLTPGNTLEDLVRYARWLSVRSEFNL